MDTTAVAAKPIRLGHAVLKMKDLAAAERFYGDLAGFDLASKRPGAIFFRLGADHHTLAVMQVGPDAAPPVKNQVGLYHLAFQVADLEALKTLYRRFKENGVEIAGTVRHGSSYSFYCFDPEGNELEFYADRYPDRDWSGVVLERDNQPLDLDS